MAKSSTAARARRRFEPHPDDPGRKPYRIVDVWKLRDLMIGASDGPRPPHEGQLLFRATLFRPFDARTPRDGDAGIGRSYWGHSARAALGFCLRVCRGYADWPPDMYEAIPYDVWLDQVRSRTIDCIPGLPETRRVGQEPQAPEAPVDPSAPTDPRMPQPFPEDDVPTKRHNITPLRPKRISEEPPGQLALRF